MVLLSVRSAEEVGPAKALLAALGGDFAFFLLFGREELRDMFGELPHGYGFDPVAVVLNANQFDLMVSFGGVLDMSFATQITLLSFFQEIGVPTVEIQHALFQAGVGPAGLAQPLGGSALQPGYAPNNVLAWEGPDGIGYLESALVDKAPASVRHDQVLVTSNNAWSGYGEKERTQFAVAVVKLASSHPDTEFIWKPRPAELVHAEASATFRMVEDYQLKNLCLARDEPLNELRGRCRLAISMFSKDLLDYQLGGKPVLMYVAELTAKLAARVRGRGFRNYEELESLWGPALERPQEFLVDCGIPPLDRERLTERLRAHVRERRLDARWLPTALRYVAYLREGRILRIELAKLQPDIADAAKRIGALEARLAALQSDVAGVQSAVSEIPGSLTGIGQRVTALQRSTWAYKAKRFMKRLNGVDD